MPVLQPAELWKRSGRYDIDEVFKLQDRRGAELVLALTHEENLTFHMARDVRSYRDLPKLLYHFQTKGRDEARPRAGVLRTREFIMKDAYSFDRDREGLDASYELFVQAYDRIFDRTGLEWYRVESDVGMMGGFGAHEYMAPCAGRRERRGALGQRLRRQRGGGERGGAARGRAARAAWTPPSAWTPREPPPSSRWPASWACRPGRSSRPSRCSWRTAARCWWWCAATTASTRSSSRTRSARPSDRPRRRRSRACSAPCRASSAPWGPAPRWWPTRRSRASAAWWRAPTSPTCTCAASSPAATSSPPGPTCGGSSPATRPPTAPRSTSSRRSRWGTSSSSASATPSPWAPATWTRTGASS